MGDYDASTAPSRAHAPNEFQKSPTWSRPRDIRSLHDEILRDNANMNGEPEDGSKKYSGYKSFQYLEAGTDYSFRRWSGR